MPKMLHQTRHFEVSQQLRALIAEMGGGDLPTQRELMDQFNASQATIGQAVRRLRREGLIYRPAGRRRLAIRPIDKPATLRICMLRPDWPSPLFDHIASTVVKHGRELGWTFEHQTYRSLREISVEDAVDGGSAVVLQTTSEPIPDRLAQALRRSTVPVVITQDHRPGLRANTVCNDDSQMARVAIRHLLELGHRRIALVLPSQQTGPMQRAISGWRQAMELAGEEDLDGLIICGDTEPGSDSRDATADAVRAHIDAHPGSFTAVYAASSTAAAATLRVLWERKLRVPEDVSVVSADGLSKECAYMIPPVTAVDTSTDEFGRAVARLIEEQIADQEGGDSGPHEPRSLWIDGWIVERHSTGPLAPGRHPKPNR